MSALPGFLMTIAKAAGPAKQVGESMTIVIRRPYSFLEKEFRSTFAGQENVKVIIDRRYGERRTVVLPCEEERRGADRRSPNEELLEVILPS
jgi:hypothetical protein